MTLPGSAKQQKLSTWPLTTASSPQMPRHSQMIFFRPSAACKDSQQFLPAHEQMKK